MLNAFNHGCDESRGNARVCYSSDRKLALIATRCGQTIILDAALADWLKRLGYDLRCVSINDDGNGNRYAKICLTVCRGNGVYKRTQRPLARMVMAVANCLRERGDVEYCAPVKGIVRYVDGDHFNLRAENLCWVDAVRADGKAHANTYEAVAEARRRFKMLDHGKNPTKEDQASLASYQNGCRVEKRP